MNFNNHTNINFTSDLLAWDASSNLRKMPWKGEKDPYKIWLSEVILQQTRVDQGLVYYEKFILAFPDVYSLARASEEQLMKMWEGLGYYNRCRNLHSAAKYISNELGGIFPRSFEHLMGLKGVGEYTAAAIASFAYNEPHAVVDGNVYRVLSRVFGVSDAIDSTTGRKVFKQLAGELIDTNQAGRYNQAIMDHGATICKPALPLCDDCPFQKYCVAFQTQELTRFPVKSKKTLVKNRWFYYVIIENGGKIFLTRRTGKDIWSGLYEFYLVERTSETDSNDLVAEIQKRFRIQPSQIAVKKISPVMDQKLTHQRIRGQFIRMTVENFPSEGEGQFVSRDELYKYPFPSFINEYIRTHYTS